MSTINEHHTTAAPAVTPSAAPTTPGSAVRASDAERESTVALLHRALGEGRLDLAETETRGAAAYAARVCDDLPPLLDDLPPPRPTATDAPDAAALWASLVWRARIRVLGSAAAGGPPTPVQQRTAALIATVALFWVVLCAFLGAGLVG